MLQKPSRLDDETERVAAIIVDCIFAVHSETGPGLLESVYEKCLAWEIASRNLKVLRQVILPIEYRGHRVDDALRIDLLIEVKAVADMHPVFKKQTLTYLKLSKLRLGFLVNFNVNLIKDGIDRIVR